MDGERERGGGTEGERGWEEHTCEHESHREKSYAVLRWRKYTVTQYWHRQHIARHLLHRHVMK